MDGNSPPSEEDILASLRIGIDEIDSTILDLLGKRFALTRQVGVIKNATRLELVDPVRESTLFHNLRLMAKDKGVDPDLVETLYRTLIAHVVLEHHHAAVDANSTDGKNDVLSN